MIRILKDITSYLEFAEEIMQDPDYLDPMLLSEEMWQNNLLRAVSREDHTVLGIFDEKDNMTGLFVYLILPEESYAEMIVGLSKDEKTYEEMFAWLEEHCHDCDTDFVFNPKNEILIRLLKERNAVFETEQQKMQLKKHVPHPITHDIRLYDPSQKDAYIAVHQDDDGRYWTSDRLLEADDKFRIIVCLQDEKIVGYIDITYCFKENEPYDVYVLPAYRGQGIGTDLMAYAIELNGDQDMTLTVDVDNDAAMHVYEKMGFVRTEGNNITVHLKGGQNDLAKEG